MKRILLVMLCVLLLGGFAFARGAAPEEEADMRIGLAFDIGGKGDQSFNDSAYRGLEMIAEEFGGYINYPDGVNFGTAIEMKPLEPKSGGQDREILLRRLRADLRGRIHVQRLAWGRRRRLSRHPLRRD